MFLSKISIRSCTIIHYNVEENIFVVVVSKLLEQKKNWNVILKIAFKQTIEMPKKGEYIKFKNFERKLKSIFMIYADFESLLVPQGNGKQKLTEFYTNKYQRHVACSYGYKLLCVDDKFSKPFKLYLREEAVSDRRK